MQTAPKPNDTVKAIDRFNVPTTDEEVRAALRKLGEPVTFFGEDKPDRRERLVRLINEAKHTNFGDNVYVEETNEGSGDVSMEESDSEDEEFYTPGPKELLAARKSMLSYSIDAAKRRIARLQNTYEPDYIKVLKHRRLLNANLGRLELYGTQMIPNNQRAVSTVRYSPSGKNVACGSWDGNVYILDKQLSVVARSTPGYHVEKASGLDWRDDTTLISGGAEGDVNYWNIPADTDSEPDMLVPSKTIKAHESRVSKALFHPDLRHFATTSFDQTWKLWDHETGTELLQQEGHSKEVFCGDFHPDGSILATGGLDAIVKLWDMRSGKLINNLCSHIQGIYSLAWNPNGYYLASGSGDCSIKIWDIRKLNGDLNSGQKEVFSIPAHKKLVSDLRFYKGHNTAFQAQPVTDENDQNPSSVSCDGTFLVSSSYDNSTAIWSTDSWIKVGQLPSADKVMSCDISPDTGSILTCHWDKSVKIWALEEV